MSKYMLTILLASALPLSTIAMEDSHERYMKLDMDKNGYLSLNETNGHHRIFYYFAKADKNSDGRIDRAEFSDFEKEVPDWEKK